MEMKTNSGKKNLRANTQGKKHPEKRYYNPEKRHYNQ